MTYKENLIIIGASGHGKVVADIAMKMSKWKSISFLDDNTHIKSSIGIPVIGKTDVAIDHKKDSDFFVAIGNNTIREKVMENLINNSLTIATLIHPSSVIGIETEIGIGTVIMAGVVINSSSIIGKGCIINTCSSIDHDNIIEDYVHLSPGVRTAGNVHIGKISWLGIGSVVTNNVNICNGCTIGAGGVVISDILKTGIYYGVPAREKQQII